MVKHRGIARAGSVAGSLALLAAVALPLGGNHVASAKQMASFSLASLPPAPHVDNARQIYKKYHGQSITFVGDSSVGNGHLFDIKLTRQFTRDTGIRVNLLPQPAASDASYQQKARAFSTHSSSIDVAMLDVVWPGAFAPYLVNLRPYFKSQVGQWYRSVVQNDTINGKLVAAPYFGDFGLLYYRTDLLKKYGYSSPPTTWDELTTMAKKIEKGEQKHNPNFYGFVFQGAAYEGLTCDSLEWLASSGGGRFFSGTRSNVDNANAIKMMKLAQSWVGTISPQGVTTYMEEDARLAFDDGNAAFMRNWPYAYPISQDPSKSKVVGKFDVAQLPHNPGSPSVGTVGGWQLGVSKYSKHIAASVELVRYMTGPRVSRYRAIAGSYVPLVFSVAHQPAVIRAQPYLAKLQSVLRVTRPSRFLRGNYIRGSTYIFQDMNSILRGQDPSSVLAQLQQQLDRLVH